MSTILDDGKRSVHPHVLMYLIGSASSNPTNLEVLCASRQYTTNFRVPRSREIDHLLSPASDVSRFQNIVWWARWPCAQYEAGLRGRRQPTYLATSDIWRLALLCSQAPGFVEAAPLNAQNTDETGFARLSTLVWQSEAGSPNIIFLNAMWTYNSIKEVQHIA